MSGTMCRHRPLGPMSRPMHFATMSVAPTTPWPFPLAMSHVNYMLSKCVHGRLWSPIGPRTSCVPPLELQMYTLGWPTSFTHTHAQNRTAPMDDHST